MTNRTDVWRIALGLWFVLAGLAYLGTASGMIVAFAWPQPMLDQFRLYRIYLELPFPENVLQWENGHRPIIPGLIRVLEIHWLAADQSLQIGVGALCALATVACIAGVALCDPRSGVVVRLAGGMLAVMAVFWFGNARMLLHGNELVHTYLLTLSVVLAALCVWRARSKPWPWMAASTACGVVATFCFGPGLALFPAVMLVAILAGVPWRAVLLPVLGGLFCAALYLFVLPDDETVRGALAFSLHETPVLAARWIASPWITAWLGFADPPLNPVAAGIMAGRNHGLLVGSANVVQSLLGLRAGNGIAVLIGMAGFGVLGIALVRAWRQRTPLTQVDGLALVLMSFGAATAVLIALARHGYFQSHPDQVFADRYQVWPCLFWLGVMLAMPGMVRGSRWLGAAVLAVVVALPLVAWPTHALWMGWGETVYRDNRASAAAARTDVFDADVLLRNDTSVTLEDKLHALALLRQHRLAMFAAPEAQWLGRQLPSTPLPVPEVRIATHWRRTVDDLRGGERRGGRIEGVVEAGMAAIPRDGVLLVLDGRNRVAGFAEFSFRSVGGYRRLLHRKSGFDAYVRDYDANAAYRLVSVSGSGEALLLDELPAQPP
ncbi:hypothetical protein OS176_10465 [Xanthomonadaceae bacterium XH05]|nr:hypothetical protein [Xanthomonadaceae bacterium XH05]